LGTRYHQYFKKKIEQTKITSTIICTLKSNIQFYPVKCMERTCSPKCTPSNQEHKCVFVYQTLRLSETL
jgi:hypothetical protein